jgi:hypothetical protein
VCWCVCGNGVEARARAKVWWEKVLPNHHRPITARVCCPFAHTVCSYASEYAFAYYGRVRIIISRPASTAKQLCGPRRTR